MDWIRGILIIILVVASNISLYFRGRRDGFDSCQELTIEYLLKIIKERQEEIDGMDS